MVILSRAGDQTIGGARILAGALVMVTRRRGERGPGEELMEVNQVEPQRRAAALEAAGDGQNHQQRARVPELGAGD
jgi:hypothetical protein